MHLCLILSVGNSLSKHERRIRLCYQLRFFSRTGTYSAHVTMPHNARCTHCTVHAARWTMHSAHTNITRSPPDVAALVGCARINLLSIGSIYLAALLTVLSPRHQYRSAAPQNKHSPGLVRQAVKTAEGAFWGPFVEAVRTQGGVACHHRVSTMIDQLGVIDSVRNRKLLILVTLPLKDL